ncbi:MAG TPA: porin [Steroidobacteraceae bacterium]|nr:porin [Steroidobacteraceae bacterium]
MSKQICAAVALAGCGLIQTAYADTTVTENTTVGGRAFIDLTSLDSKTAGVKNAASGFGLDVKRFYLILDHTFDEIWSANLTTDFNYVSADSETQVFIKKAYVQAKISDAFFVRAGSADLPWIPYVESNYGYRYIEKTIEDRLSFGNTADWGVHAGGKMADGMFGYAVSTIEGNGYKNPTRSKTLDWEGRVNFTPIKGLAVAVGFYNGKLGKDVEGTPTPALHTAQRSDAMVAYTNDMFRVGGEYFKADNWTAVTLVPEDSADGFSVWGSVNFTPKVSGFARYDNAKPNKDTVPDRKDEYFNLGVSCKPRKGVELAVVYKHDEVKAGGVKSSEMDEFGVWSQISF